MNMGAEEAVMFGLPTATVVICLGVMAFWVIYTVVFYASTSSWRREDEREDQEATP